MRRTCLLLLISLFSALEASEWEPLRKVVLPEGPHLAFRRDTRSDLVIVALHIPLPVKSSLPKGAGPLLAEILKKQAGLEMAPLSGTPVYSLISYATQEGLKLSFHLLRSDVDPVLHNTLTKLLKPEINQEILDEAYEKIRKQAQAGMMEPAQISLLKNHVFNSFLRDEYNYAEHPGSEDAARLSVEQVKKLYAEGVGAPELSFAVSGNVTLKEVAPLIRESLKNLPSQASRAVEPLETPQREAYFPAGKNRSLASLNFAMPRADSELWPVFWLMDDILKVGHSGMYEKTLREAGMTEKKAEIIHSRGRSILMLPWQGNRISASFAINRVKGVLQLFNEKEISEEEMQIIHQRRLNQISDDLSNPIFQTSFSVSWEAYQWPNVLLDEIRLAILRINPATIREFFRRFVNPEQAQLTAIVANKDVPDEKVERFEYGLTRNVGLIVRRDIRQEQVGVAAVLRLPESADPRISYLAAHAIREAGIRLKSPEVARIYQSLGLEAEVRMIGQDILYALSGHASMLENFLKILPQLVYGMEVDLNALASARQSLIVQKENLGTLELGVARLFERASPASVGAYAAALDFRKTSFRDSDVLEWLQENREKLKLSFGVVGPVEPEMVEQNLRSQLESQGFEMVDKSFFPEAPSFEDLVSQSVSTKITTSTKGDEFALVLADFYPREEVSPMEQACIVVTVLRVLRNRALLEEDMKGLRVDLSATTNPFVQIVFGVSGLVREREHVEKRILEYLEEAASFDSDEALTTFRKYVQWARNIEHLLPSAQAGTLAVQGIYDMDGELEEKLLGALENVTLKDVQATFDKFFRWKWRLELTPSQP